MAPANIRSDFKNRIWVQDSVFATPKVWLRRDRRGGAASSRHTEVPAWSFPLLGSQTAVPTEADQGFETKHQQRDFSASGGLVRRWRVGPKDIFRMASTKVDGPAAI